MGMAFTDALIDHAPDVRVALVDRRHGVGGHWLEAYPFVQLHQSSTLLRRRVDAARWWAGAGARAGGGVARAGGAARDPRLLRRRAGRPAARVGAGRVLPRLRRTSATAPSCRGSPEQAFEMPGRLPGGRRALPRAGHPGRAAAAVRASATAPAWSRSTTSCTSRRRRASTSSSAPARPPPTRASGCSARGVDPGAICWVRPREPWMLNRALIQPDPVVYLGMVGSMLEAAALGRVPRRPVPPPRGRRDHAAHRPLGHADDGEGAHARHLGARAAPEHRGRRPPRSHPAPSRAAGSTWSEGSVSVADDALVVNCAADGLKNPPLVPIWQPSAHHPPAGPRRLPVLRRRADRVRRGDPLRRRHQERAVPPLVVRQLPGRLGPDERPGPPERRRVQLRARHQGLGQPRRRSTPSRVPPEHAGSAELHGVLERVAARAEPGLARLAELMV